ncbi:MAG: polyprenol monophosphomannose synthase [Acidimicrobiales bacterium]
MRALVVLPTYNEAENIDEVLRRIRLADPRLHVLVVDDSSPDGTADVAEAIGAEQGGVDVLRRPGKAGLGSAYRDGFAWGLARDYDVLVEMDSDLSHDPAALPSLIGPVADGVDLVVGSRYVPGGAIPEWSPHRKALSRAGNVYASLMLGLRVKDMTSGFRAYSASILGRIDMDRVRADGYGFQIEMAYLAAQAGGVVAEVPICFVDRLRGQSKMSMKIVVEALALVTWWGLRRLWYPRTESPVPAGTSGRID